MAKASVSSSLKIPRNREEQPEGELTDITYKVVNNPSALYVVPHLVDQVLRTPYYYSHSTGTVDKSLYFESPGTLEENYTSLSKSGAVTCVYCMENANESPGADNATLALIKGIFTPDELYAADGQTLFTGYQKGDTFWRVAEYKNGSRGAFQDRYYGENPADYLTSGWVAMEYAGGQTIYPVFLYNSEYEGSESRESPYTVRRNSYYHIDITKVNGAGEPVEDNLIEPPKGEGSKIEVMIRIAKWQEIEQSGKI
ncbi:MAG: fimbria major subunit [Rikenellaceae bacterium]|nr:fimbria major subunit [Rikenellaceae bacterium]